MFTAEPAKGAEFHFAFSPRTLRTLRLNFFLFDAKMTEFDILLFSPGQPAHGERARARFDDGALFVNGNRVEAPLDEIGLTLGGSDRRQVFLFWHSRKDGEEGRWAFSPADENALAQLTASAPAPLSGLLKTAAGDISRRQRRLRLGPGSRILLLLLALLLAGAVIWQWHAIADWAIVKFTSR